MRSFLAAWRDRFPDDYAEIDRPVDPLFELVAVQRKLSEAGRLPILQFNQVGETGIPVVTNLYASRERIAFGLGCGERELVSVLQRAEANPVAPVRVAAPPSQEVAWDGADLDLRRLPVCRSHEADAAPYLTSGLVLASDPESGAHNVSFGRLQLVDGQTVYTHVTPGRHLHQLLTQAEKRDEPLPVSVNLGHHPAHALGGTSLVPFGFDELGVMGSLAGEPVRVARCLGQPADCLADAEIVLEGYIVPNQKAAEGPFCEFPGYATGVRPREIVRVTAVTTRHDPIYQHITASTNDHRLLGAVGKEARLQQAARSAAPSVRAVHLPLSGCGRFHCYVSLEQKARGQARGVAMAILGADIYCKTVFVVDHDIDVFDERQVLWAVATRVQPNRDIMLIPGTLGSDLDPSADEDGIVCKMIVDATAKPSLAEYHPRAVVPTEVMERVRLEDYLPAYAK